MRRFSIDAAADERREFEAVLRRQFVVRGEDEFITSFDPVEGDTLAEAVDDLVAYFDAPDGDGYAGRDMVVWQGGRVVALVRRGDDGQPHATVFDDRR